MMKRLLCLSAAYLLAGCVANQPIKQDLSAFNTAKPRSVLVVPVVNKSLDVDAQNYALAALPVPIAEKGYYVFPVNTTKFVLEQEGFYEGDRIHEQPPSSLAKLFDADAVLYVTIHRWDAQYALLTTTVTVEFEYKMVSKDDTTIWSERKQMRYAPQNDSGGHPVAQLLGALISAAITRAAPNYMPLTKQANQQVFITGPNTLPNGPYRPVESK
jgi:hypothetical protein